MSSATTNPPSKYNHAVADPVSYFHAIPWCHELLTSKRIVVPPSPPDRNPLASTEANIVRVTLNTPSTVKASVTWLQLPTREQRAEHIGETREKPFLEICALMDCNEGLAGRPGIMHGGITAVILDELLSTIAYMQGGTLNHTRLKHHSSNPISPLFRPRTSTFLLPQQSISLTCT